jgi:hypothetical protein
MVVDDTIPKFDMPTFMDLVASNEQDVVYALERNVLEVLSTIGGRQLLRENFRSSTAQIKGKPDRVFLADEKLIFPVEVKTRWILPDDNIVEIYNARDTPECVSNSVMQIFGYMAHNERRYGVLSTYDKTWFLRRPENDPGALLISDAVKVGDTSPTLLWCFAYMMSLACQDFECPFPAPSPPRSLGDYDTESAEEKDDTDGEDEDPTYEPRKPRSRKGGHGSGRKGGHGTWQRQKSLPAKNKRLLVTSS